MNARLIKLWNDLQSSYYFIPGLMALGAVLLAMLTSHIDKTWEYKLAENLGWFYSNKAEGARAILTTIAGSMMTVASVTFSITMVAVTSAAGQYGPRLIGNFMRDRANQITLGTFTSTFVYCLLILRITRTGDASGMDNAVSEFVPNLSLLVAMGTAILNWATENDAVIRLQYRPGDFAIYGDELMHVWRNEHRNTPLDDQALDKLRAGYAMGQDRTAHQNILFLADELVEILARALSPGVNDPFTAINCINWFQSAIKTMMAVTPPSPYRKDENGDIRVISYPVSFERFVSVICDQSRSYIATDKNTVLKMLTALTELAQQAQNTDHQKILKDQISKLQMAALDALEIKLDRDELSAEFNKSNHMISDPDYYADIQSSQGWGGGRS